MLWIRHVPIVLYGIVATALTLIIIVIGYIIYRPLFKAYFATSMRGVSFDR